MVSYAPVSVICESRKKTAKRHWIEGDVGIAVVLTRLQESYSVLMYMSRMWPYAYVVQALHHTCLHGAYMKSSIAKERRRVYTSPNIRLCSFRAESSVHDICHCCKKTDNNKAIDNRPKICSRLSRAITSSLYSRLCTHWQ